MSRLRRSLIELNSLSENDYLEPLEQDQLIALLSDISYKQNKKLIRIFALVFFLLNPIYLLSPSFRKNAIGLACLIVIDLSSLNMLWFNQYAVLKENLVSNTLDEDRMPQSRFKEFHSQKRSNLLNKSKEINRASSRITDRLNDYKSKKALKIVGNLHLQIQKSKQLIGQNPHFHNLFQLLLFLSSVLIACQRFKGCVNSFEGDCLFIFLPLFTSTTSIVVNIWIKDLVNQISGLNNYKYQKKFT